MPFGLHGAAATFQRVMDRVLTPHQEYAAAYIDDIVIYSPTWGEHLKHVDAVLTALDASEVGLGAVLAQEEQGADQPVLYLSRKLLPRERAYATIEKEALAVKWAIDTLRYYLWGNKFKLVTDHAPLVWLNSMKETNARIMRWYLALQPYCFEVVHRPGATHQNADFFSRIGEQSPPGARLSKGGRCVTDPAGSALEEGAGLPPPREKPRAANGAPTGIAAPELGPRQAQPRAPRRERGRGRAARKQPARPPRLAALNGARTHAGERAGAAAAHGQGGTPGRHSPAPIKMAAGQTEGGAGARRQRPWLPGAPRARPPGRPRRKESAAGDSRWDAPGDFGAVSAPQSAPSPGRTSREWKEPEAGPFWRPWAEESGAATPSAVEGDA
ncbi:uncharacterized protein LOC142831036 [Pelodiscus sinensis]|uniref:uncharacterized protein LOC142831036 n=1 Tax=Pelodiscus sinensis TaxID=13735 RepID=UPI003F6C9C87